MSSQGIQSQCLHTKRKSTASLQSENLAFLTVCVSQSRMNSLHSLHDVPILTLMFSDFVPQREQHPIVPIFYGIKIIRHAVAIGHVRSKPLLPSQPHHHTDTAIPPHTNSLFEFLLLLLLLHLCVATTIATDGCVCV